MTKEIKLYLIVGVIAIAAFWLFLKNSASIGFTIGKGAVDAVTGTAGGIVAGAGTVVGIPLTNAQECARCKAIRDYFGVSKFCSASDFLSWVVTGK